MTTLTESIHHARRDALAVVANHAMANAVQGLEWEDYPELSQRDWESLIAMVNRTISFPPGSEFTAAYEYLTVLCKGEEASQK